MLEGIGEVSAVNIVVVLSILVLTFGAIFTNKLNRTVCVVLGASALLVAGPLLGFYDEQKAFRSIYLSPIFIFISMSIFSLLLDDLKFFSYVAKKMIIRTNGEIRKIVCSISIMTYVASLFVNNLTTILVIVPITLYLARGLKINPVPIAIAAIIASNIGGASTMIGDFPNMLIASTTNLKFIDFMIFMFPICLLELVFLLWYMRGTGMCPIDRGKGFVPDKEFFQSLKDDIEKMDIDWPAVKRVLWSLFGLIVAFNILPYFGIRPASIALTGGFLVLAVEKKHTVNVLRKVSFSDIIFFMSLFIIVGATYYSGILGIISGGITNLSMGNKTLYLLLLMWSAALVTAFLNAGPSTAFFVPMAMQSYFIACGDISWWALSLGVLAGSSATITGATAGIVTQTLFEEHASKASSDETPRLITFSNYAKRGIPIALMFLVISSIYITILLWSRGIQ
ncbi:MAG: hypothetical protein HQL29_01330 [Candidatus Omnitrophica bacterium]|nr:hypothetical protein [Candidatus Omnitrophota bacterium]